MNDLELFSSVSNPLDGIEDIMTRQDWSFERPTPEELMVQISGKRGHYQMSFLWQEDYSAMQFYCALDLEIPETREKLTNKTLRDINETLWLGHFDVPSDTRTPFFRHTTLFRGMTHTSGTDHIADLIEVALAQCEKHYHVFHMLSSSAALNDNLMSLALTTTDGEA